MMGSDFPGHPIAADGRRPACETGKGARAGPSSGHKAVVNSEPLPSFWSAYASLPEDTKRSAWKADQLWADNPFHPSLRFKCINHEENIWSVRITRSYRALGFLEGHTVT